MLGTMKQKQLILILVFAVLLILTVASVIYFKNQRKIKSINSFEECAAAGYPILESYPEQCMTPDGRSFTRILSKSEQGKLDEQVRNEYYGFSTFSECESDDDCFVSGCNSEICQGVGEEGISSVCVIPDRETPSQLGFSCRCRDEMCGWGK